MAMSENSGQGLPCGFSLLPDKKQQTYELMLSTIVQKVGPNRRVNAVCCDFEKSMINSVRAILGTQIDIRGCGFHFRKSIWRHISDCGLQNFFYGETTFNELVYKIYALSLVPAEDVVQFYQEQIVDVIDSKLDQDEDWKEGHEELNDFMEYMDKTWIGKPIRGRPGARRSPLFDYKLWNQYQAFLEEEDVVTTNNCLESWSRTWNGLMGVSPNVFKVISGFIDQESETKRILVTQATGRDMSDNTGRKSMSKECKDRIKAVVQQYRTLPSKEYLTILVHELSFKNS